MTESQDGFSDDQLFVTLVTDLITQAWVALGKIKHPATDKIERSIPAAGLIIDMLDMLNRKTAGNRSEVEDRLLLDSLQQLKINYIAEADKPEAPEEETAEKKPEEQVTEEAPDEQAAEEKPAKATRTSEAADPKEAEKKGPKKKKSQADQSPKPSSRKK